MKRIAVLTSGGDAPGMNPAIRAVVRTGLDQGWDVLGVRHGYAGLVAGDIAPLGGREVGGIIQQGGTLLGSARCPEFEFEEGRLEALREIQDHDIEGLVVIGGNGSQTGAYKLSQMGFPVVGVASTIDNDLYGSEMTIGVDTALNIALEAIDRLRVTAVSHQRAFLVEVMGRDCGYLALMAGLAGGADAVVIPEVEIEPEELATVLRGAWERGKPHALVVVAEGADHPDLDAWADEIAKGLHGTRLGEASVEIDSFGHPLLKERRVGDWTAYHIKKELGWDTRVSVMAHLMRGGQPTLEDRILGARMGIAAADYVQQGNFGVMVSLHGREVVPFPLEKLTDENGKSITRDLTPEWMEFADILMK